VANTEVAPVQTTDNTPSTQALNEKVACFDVVISIADEFPYLVGEVNAVDKRYAAEHNLSHLYDEVFVDFRSEEYSEQRKREIESHFGQRFDRISLDNVPMAPDLLIVVPERDIPQLLESRESAEAYCKAILENMIDPETELIARVEQNYADFKQSLDGFSKNELIEMAGKIHAYSDAWSYMTAYHAFSDEEIQFYLTFQNPLEIVADAWRERNIDQEEMSYTMDSVYEQRTQHLTQYALVSDGETPADTGLRRFMGVDVLDFLGKITEKTMLHQHNDWQIDREALYRATSSDDADDRRLVWHVCSSGTHLQPECEVFVRGSWANVCMTNYRETDPDMFGYAVEVTGRGEKGVVIGNVYEVGDYTEYAKHIQKETLPCGSLTLTYSEEWGENAGNVITVSAADFDKRRKQLMNESGEVIKMRYNPADESRLQDILRDERNKRMSYPIGSQEAHLRKITEKLYEIRKPPEQEKSVPSKEKSAFDKALNRGKEKSDAYKAQKAQEPANPKNKQEVIE